MANDIEEQPPTDEANGQPGDVEARQGMDDDLGRNAHDERVRHALAANSERFHTIFNTINEGIFLHDSATGCVVDTNDAVLQMYGYEREDFHRISVGDLSSGIAPYTQKEAVAKFVLANAGTPQSFEWHARHHDGSLFWVNVTLKAASIGSENFILAVVADITERKNHREEIEASVRDLVAINKKLEDAHLQLLQSEKMASIGQLAAGVAHEINNPIGYVFSNLGSLEKYLQDLFAMLDVYEQAEPALDAGSREKVQRLRQELEISYLRQDSVALLAETREGIERVRKIVLDLKDFSRVGSEDEWQWVDLHAGLDSTLNIVWNELKYKTTVIREYGQLPKIYCLPSQINQVFMNLLVNAAHAIERKGVINVRTGQDGGEVWIEVEDSGCGIPAENLKRIFDPFFTTKAVGKGTGLGLSVSYSIVQKHQGRIDVRSELGKGSVFRVWLPIEPKVPEEKTGD